MTKTDNIRPPANLLGTSNKLAMEHRLLPLTWKILHGWVFGKVLPHVRTSLGVDPQIVTVSVMPRDAT